MSDASIVTKDLVKDYKFIFKTKIRAVDSVSIEIQRGEIFGLLGPNGAGKTTIIKILATILRPTLGSALVLGYHVIREADKIRKKIVLVQQQTALDSSLNVKDTLTIYAKLHGVAGPELKRRLNWALEQFGLDGHKTVSCSSLSGGFGRRVQLARALMCDGELLFLDEPTVGLDPQAKRKTRELIREWAQKNDATILMTTQSMEDAEILCDRVAILNHGKVISRGRIPELMKLVGNASVIEFSLANMSDYTPSFLDSIPGVVGVNSSDEGLSVMSYEPESVLPKVVNELTYKGITISSVITRKPTLEDVFIKLLSSPSPEKLAYD